MPVHLPAYAGTTLCCLVTEAMCVNNLSIVALNNAVAEIELAISSRVSTRELHGDGDSGFPAGPTGNPWVLG